MLHGIVLTRFSFSVTLFSNKLPTYYICFAILSLALFKTKLRCTSLHPVSPNTNLLRCLKPSWGVHHSTPFPPIQKRGGSQGSTLSSAHIIHNLPLKSHLTLIYKKIKISIPKLTPIDTFLVAKIL